MTQPIRDAATIILLRDTEQGPSVLMGQRGAKAAFMPNKFVFPGGAVDAGDASVPLAGPLTKATDHRLTLNSDLESDALAVAAIRELWEETGLMINAPATWENPPKDWHGFVGMPDASGLAFLFRAITPPARPRRFDARFFVADISVVTNDPDDFSAASDELSNLSWLPIETARDYDLPFVTQIVLAELERFIARDRRIEQVPFFSQKGDENCVLHLS